MDKIKAIANAIAGLVMAVVDEVGRRRRRAQNFQMLSRRRELQPFLVTRKVRFARTPGPAVSFFPGTREAWRVQAAGPVRVLMR